MPLLAIALVIQIIVGGLLLNISTNSPSVKIIKHSLKQVLGASLLAQDEIPTDIPIPDQTTPTDTPIPVDQPTDTPQPSDIPTDIPTFSPTSGTSLTPTQNPGDEQNNPSPTDASTSSVQEPSSTSLDTNNPASPSDSSFSDTPDVNNAVMNPLDMLIKTDDISQDSLNASQKQDEAVSAAATPQDKTDILISSTQSNIQEVTNNLTSHDFTTTAFLTQRIEDHLQQTQQIEQSAPQLIQNQLHQEAKKFCDAADLVLKTQQLQVPEDLEQDVEIARGTCLNIQQ